MNYKESCEKLRLDLLGKKIEIEALRDYKNSVFEPMIDAILMGEIKDLKTITNYLYLCLDYYTFTEDILISDYDYDMIMNMYVGLGGTRIYEADPISSNVWPIVNHEDRSMVGSIEKIYTEDEFDIYYNRYAYYKDWIVAPKYDGISAAVKVENGEIKKAWTRYDGMKGQDITPVVANAKNADTFMYHFETSEIDPDGFYKVELAVGNDEFEQLILEKEYANRRSATSGIVNTPKNLHLAKYITIIPLAKKRKNGILEYRPLGSRYEEHVGSSKYLMQCIKDTLYRCAEKDFQFRYDGVVIFPVTESYNDEDILNDSIAFKINTKFGMTTVKRLYISIGRTGKAMPMAEVYPVEVNETRVHDVSLGSIGNYLTMDLRKGEQIVVYSAGDVIPQIMKPDKDTLRDKTGEKLVLPLVCPYCGENLHVKGKEMFCTNKECRRFLVGRIANFLDKLGVENVSDSTIEELFLHEMVEKLPDVFKLDKAEIAEIPGHGPRSAELIVNNINSIIGTPITVDKFYGALGIPDCAELTCRKIFSVIDIKDIDKTFVNGKWFDLKLKIQGTKGIGEKIATSFVNFVKEYDEEIQDLLDILTVVGLPSYKGNVVFTGFRDSEAESKFNNIGYEVSNNVTSKTKAVINNSYSKSSGKCKDAMKNDIPIIHRTRIDDVLDYLRNEWDLEDLVYYPEAQ